MAKRKDLVMGAIKGYDMEQCAPFVVSLKRSGFEGDVVFFYRDLSDDTRKQLSEHGVILLPMQYHGRGVLNSWSRFWKWLQPFVKLAGRSGPGRLVMKMITPFQTSRFYSYHDFLVQNIDKYRNVLITDIRDVIFQDDPFRRFNAVKVQCYEEDRDLYEDTQFNLPWIWKLYGENAADSFKNKKIVCSGTIMGPADELIKYIGQMEKLLIEANDVGVGGSDQGLHNYVLYTTTHNANIVPNGVGEVLTIFESNISAYPINDGLFRGPAGEVIPVVHQYDRVSVLRDALLKRLSLN